MESWPVEAILKKVGKDACKPKGVAKGVGLTGNHINFLMIRQKLFLN